MPHKKSRFGPRLVAAAENGSHYRDVHVFIGGTGAVGGAAVLQMIGMFEEMMSIQPPKSAADVPILVVTGRGEEDVDAFVTRLKRLTRARWGSDASLRRFEQGYLTPSGVYVAVSVWNVKPVPGLDDVTEADPDRKQAAIDEFLLAAGTTARSAPGDIMTALRAYVCKVRPLSTFFEASLERLRDYGPAPFRSLIIGLPLPSILAYQLGGLTDVARAVGLTDEFARDLKHDFETTFADDLLAVRHRWGIRIFVAHTTGVGGMYDEVEGGGTNPRLGFAHAAIDDVLRHKHTEAERITLEYSRRGLYVLVTAAAIGIDEVKVAERIPMNRAVVDELRRVPRELYRGMRSRRTLVTEGVTRSVAARQFLRVLRPLTLSAAVEGPPPESRPLFFKTVRELRPAFSIRSGENGFFSAANADALYRVMKVASASELGHVLASVALLGDDPAAPWFHTANTYAMDGGVCYYTETANAKQVFDFLYQPSLFGTQVSGLEPLALQDLGSAKHQAELHTLALLILLHRLQTADFDRLPPYASASFDPARFLVDTSRPLTFRDVDSWDVPKLHDDLKTLVMARSRGHLLPLKPIRDPGQFGARDEAHLAVLSAVLDAVWTIPSLGSPIIVDDGGRLVARSGYYIAPFGRVIRDQSGLSQLFQGAFASASPDCSAEQYQAFQMSVNGFIDLRLVGVVCSARTTEELRPDRVTVALDQKTFEDALAALRPYSFFATCGLLAIVHRLRALGAFLRSARADLGTMQDCVWNMPRDEHGHLQVVPGIVEAFRMVSEGQEKTTGTEWLDGFWGYARRLPANRVQSVIDATRTR